MSSRSGYRGYVSARPFGGLRIPVPVQALMMRDYCNRHGYLYKLHEAENTFPHSYLVLEGMIGELGNYEGLLATSMSMMPEQPKRRVRIYERILGLGASLHFVFEDFVIRKTDDIAPIEELLAIDALVSRSDQDVPPDENP